MVEFSAIYQFHRLTRSAVVRDNLRPLETYVLKVLRMASPSDDYESLRVKVFRLLDRIAATIRYGEQQRQNPQATTPTTPPSLLHTEVGGLSTEQHTPHDQRASQNLDQTHNTPPDE